MAINTIATIRSGYARRSTEPEGYCMKRRLVLACLTTTNVVARCRTEFDAVITDGPDDMTVEEVVRAATAHQAEAILFTNTLPLDAAAIAALPASVRVGATSSVGYD